MLKIREFVKGEDEEVWLRIRNEAFEEYDDFRPGTMEDMEIWQKDPGFDPVGMFIAELDKEPVGRVHACYSPLVRQDISNKEKMVGHRSKPSNVLHRALRHRCQLM